MGKALYREYRPKRLTDVVGQEHVTSTLANALKSGKISHAYLFTGPRGTGKTTIARILAHEINQLEYVDDSTHLDIIEIDAASNRRIDEIRELRERVHNAPTSVKYKVYIIDEVHMLTKEAFNALLKTLEEPPAHAIFILATTEVHKLPETIISRTQRFSMKPAGSDNIVKLLRDIADKEKFAITDEALAVIAEAGNGSFRDSVSLLDQSRNASDSITEEDAYRVLGIAPRTAVDSLVAALDGGPSAIVTTLKELKSNGYQSGQLAKQLGVSLRTKLLDVSAQDAAAYLDLLHSLLEVPYAKDIDAKLELVLIGFGLGSVPANHKPASSTSAPRQTAPPSKPTPVATLKPLVVENEPLAPVVVEPDPPTTEPEPPVSEVEPQVEPTLPSAEPVEQAAAPQASEPFSPQVWQQALNNIKQKYNTLYGVVRMAQPELDGDTLVLKFAFGFHQKRINEAKNKQLVAQTVKELTGKEMAIVCIVEKTAVPPAAVAVPDKLATPTVTPSLTLATQAAPTEPATNLDVISDIFGGAEVLES